MLLVDLFRLWTERTLAIEASIEPASSLWAGCELTFAAPVVVTGTASRLADGGVLVRGEWQTEVRYECGRCLEEKCLPVRKPLNLVYVPESSREGEDSDPDVRLLSQKATTLDLKEAVREEVMLAVPRYFLPKKRENGLCSLCGLEVRSYFGAPEAAGQGSDSRWSPLRALLPDHDAPAPVGDEVAGDDRRRSASAGRDAN